MECPGMCHNQKQSNRLSQLSLATSCMSVCGVCSLIFTTDFLLLWLPLLKTGNQTMVTQVFSSLLQNTFLSSSDPLIMPNTSSSTHDIKRIRKGIFEVAFEQPQSIRALWIDFVSDLPLIYRRSKEAGQLLKELFLIAPISLTLYVIAALWPCIMSAFYLWSVAFLLEVVRLDSLLSQNYQQLLNLGR